MLILCTISTFHLRFSQWKNKSSNRAKLLAIAINIVYRYIKSITWVMMGIYGSVEVRHSESISPALLSHRCQHLQMDRTTDEHCLTLGSLCSVLIKVTRRMAPKIGRSVYIALSVVNN